MQSLSPALGPTLRVPEIAVRGANRDSDPLAQWRADMYALQPIREAKLIEAATALEEGRDTDAKRVASKFLGKHPRNADALNILSDVAKRAGDLPESERYLAQAIRWAPDHQAYRYNYIVVLWGLEKLKPALDQAEILLEKDPRNLLFRTVKGQLLNLTRQYVDAADMFRELTIEAPELSETWIGLANALRAMGGHTEEVVSCLRKVTAFDPAAGAAWWALASMKTSRMTAEDVRAMEEQLARPARVASERVDLYYALGKACDDTKQFEKSFQYYSKGNAVRRIGLDYDPQSTTSAVSRAKETFTPELFHAREGAGCLSRDPIFVLGMQRSGSTLTEQILGAHSQIEVAGELQTLGRIVAADVMPKTGPNYPSGMEKLTVDELRSLGEKYLELVRVQRKEGKPFFVDKNCYNIWQVGLIPLILPNAKIIDIRRHPIACCWANFTVSFAHAPPLSYKLTDIGRFYHDYVRLMAHFDRVMPGRVHRVIYENLVADLEGEVRRMLEFLELPFEPGCLEYYKSDRAFNSFSNEQVRRPIFKDGVERWRDFEPWLGPLKEALGPVLGAYPNVPEFPD